MDEIQAAADALSSAADELEQHANVMRAEPGSTAETKAQQMRIDSRWLRRRAVELRMQLL